MYCRKLLPYSHFPNLCNMQEPWGVVCVGYVNEGSANHQLLKKLGAVTESDEALWELQAG